MTYDRSRQRTLRLESLEGRLCLAASVGWDGFGLGSASLTYYIDELPSGMDLTDEEVHSGIETALNAWADIADITFSETEVPGENNSIDFTFGTIDGEGGTLALAYYPDDINSEPIAGDVIFDVDETWEIGNDLSDKAYDLALVAAHEVGHSLGLDHSLVPGSVMVDDPSADQMFAGLGQTDKSAILALYAPTTPIESTTITLDKTELTDGDLITLTGIVDVPSETNAFPVLVFWGDGSAVETLVVPPGASTFSISHLYPTDSNDWTDSTYEVFYATMDDESGSDMTYLVASVVRYDLTVVDLGTVEYTTVDDVSLADEASYYQFVTARDGILTLETLVADAGDEVAIELYNHNSVENSGLLPVTVSAQNDEGQRIDYQVTAGQTYYVKLEGTGMDFDLRITNLVHQDGAVITVFGTEGDDAFEFNAADGRQATINGVLYELPEDGTLTVNFEGGNGYDKVVLQDSPGDDSLEAWATEAVLANSQTDAIANFTVSVGEFEELHVYARSDGNDTAVLYDSEGNDKFKAEPAEGYAKMYGGAMYNRVKFFDVVEAYSSGGSDLARLFDTAGDDTFDGQKDKSGLSGVGYNVQAHGFSQVIAYASQGTDTASFADSMMTDEFHAKSTKAELFDAATDGEVYKVTARHFDSYRAEASITGVEGGDDIAKVWPTSLDDRIEATDAWFRLWAASDSSKLLHEITGFETIKVRDTEGTNDSAVVDESVSYDLVLGEGWQQ